MYSGTAIYTMTRLHVPLCRTATNTGTHGSPFRGEREHPVQIHCQLEYFRPQTEEHVQTKITKRTLMFCQFFLSREARKLAASCTFSSISFLGCSTLATATERHITWKKHHISWCYATSSWNDRRWFLCRGVLHLIVVKDRVVRAYALPQCRGNRRILSVVLLSILIFGRQLCCRHC